MTRVRTAREARWWLLARGLDPELARVGEHEWTLGDHVVRIDPDAGPALDPVDLAQLAHALVLGVPFRTELLGRALLSRYVDTLAEAAALRAAIREFLPPGADALPESAFRHEGANPAAFTRADLDERDAQLDELLSAMTAARDAAAPEPDADGPPPLTAPTAREIRARVAVGAPLVPALQAAADVVPVAFTPVARVDAGQGRATCFLVAAEPGEPTRSELLVAVIGADDAILGRVLLTGAAARAQYAAADQAAGGGAEGRARGLAEQLAEQLTPVLRAAAEGGERAAEVTRSLAPRPGDAARAFTGDVARAVQEASDAAWASDDPPRITARPDQTEIDVSMAPVGALADGHPLAGPFPGAYRALAEHMVPGRVWVTWVHRAPGQPRGVRYDGLVWLDDHWAWFPKPWRAAREVLS